MPYKKPLTAEQRLKRAEQQRRYMKKYFANHPDQAEKNRVRARERMRRLLGWYDGLEEQIY